MKNSIFLLISLTLCIPLLLELVVEAVPTGTFIKHLFPLLKWTNPSSEAPQSDGNVVQFQKGYLVETVVERGHKLGFEPYSIRVSQEGELLAVDAINSNIVRITPPLSQYSRARLVAGSFQGHSGYVDGKPSDAHFHHPKGVTMDDKGNIYVADTSNMAIRKIGEAGVTTIAGGKSNVAGYSDGPSEDAKFSSDFDVVYIAHTCSLLVVDRGNAALRQISLHQEDCNYQYSSISASDIFMVVGAVLVGYASCLLQHGFGPSTSRNNQEREVTFKDLPSEEKPSLIEESLEEDPVAGWSSLGRLFADFLRLAFELLGNIFLYFIPLSESWMSKKGLTPIKDTLRMPEDKLETPLVQRPEPPVAQRQRSPSPFSETLHAPNKSNSHSQEKLQNTKPATLKDFSLSRNYRSSVRLESADASGSNKTPPYSLLGSKSQKDRTRHRHQSKSGEVAFGATGAEPKKVEIKPVNYDDPQFNHYNIRSNSGTDMRSNFGADYLFNF